MQPLFLTKHWIVLWIKIKFPVDKTVLLLIKLPAQAAWCSGKEHIFLFLFLKNISLSEDQILLGMALWFLRPLLLVLSILYANFKNSLWFYVEMICVSLIHRPGMIPCFLSRNHCIRSESCAFYFWKCKSPRSSSQVEPFCPIGAVNPLFWTVKLHPTLPLLNFGETNIFMPQ